MTRYDTIKKRRMNVQCLKLEEISLLYFLWYCCKVLILFFCELILISFSFHVSYYLKLFWFPPLNLISLSFIIPLSITYNFSFSQSWNLNTFSIMMSEFNIFCVSLVITYLVFLWFIFSLAFFALVFAVSLVVCCVVYFQIFFEFPWRLRHLQTTNIASHY